MLVAIHGPDNSEFYFKTAKNIWGKVLILSQHISAIWLEETRIPGENHRPVVCHRRTLSHNALSSKPRHERDSNSQF
jgi:hypothetical protein